VLHAHRLEALGQAAGAYAPVEVGDRERGGVRGVALIDEAEPGDALAVGRDDGVLLGTIRLRDAGWAAGGGVEGPDVVREEFVVGVGAAGSMEIDGFAVRRPGQVRRRAGNRRSIASAGRRR
jgi:hypothetical protein